MQLSLPSALGNLPWVEVSFIQPSPSWTYFYFQLGVTGL